MWTVNYTKRFLKELAALPTAIQTRVEPIAFQALEAENHFALGDLEKMKGYEVRADISINFIVCSYIKQNDDFTLGFLIFLNGKDNSTVVATGTSL